MFIQNSSATVRTLPRVENQEIVEPKALNLAPLQTVRPQRPFTCLTDFEILKLRTPRGARKKAVLFLNVLNSKYNVLYQEEAQTTLSWEQVLETTDVPTTKSHQGEKAQN